ncbi:hypothetical protein [Cryobacterium sp. 10I5]|uniref:hypothetical protein n=1 Tax=Cryobacterium sp. 10I5 TaxID=3048581 RepID=UPI002B2259AA|nr:hypothetical protein [Cryobacterium sp. 10I5]MEB0265905.1 hypothetical protein [Cryobacterium sp. 10I5]
MNTKTHQDHAANAQAAYDDAENREDQLERLEMLGVAAYHAAMASYTLGLENAAHTE